MIWSSGRLLQTFKIFRFFLFQPKAGMMMMLMVMVMIKVAIVMMVMVIVMNSDDSKDDNVGDDWI